MSAMQRVRRAVALIGIVACTAPLAAQTEVSVRRAIASDASLRVQGAFGSLRVIGWAQDSVVLTGVLPQGTRVDAAFASAPTGGGPPRGGKIFVEAPDRGTPGKMGSLEIRVPARIRLWVKAGSANIDVSGVTGGLDINIVGGSIKVTGSPRELRAEAMDGNVRIEGAPEWLRSKTASGDITLSGGGSDLGLSTVSGAVRVTDGTVERLRIETVTGLVLLAGRLANGGVADIDSHSGPVELRLPLQSNIEADVISLTGSIDNQWTATRPIAGREGRGMELATQSGMPGARVTVRSFKGTVMLRADKPQKVKAGN